MKKVLGKKPAVKKTKRMSVRIPVSMLNDINENILKASLPIKHRSRWISEAISNLHKEPNCFDFISEERIDPGNNVLIQVSLEQNAEKSLIEMSTKANVLLNKDPYSSIIRTAIIHKIMKTN